MTRNIKGQFVKGSGLKDLTNRRFGRLTALKLSEKRSGRKTFWDCVCDCGNTKTVRTDSLKSGAIQSCGCLKKEQNKINLPKGQGRLEHGLARERIYHIWLGMIKRCENEEDSHFSSYGGRGIKVCKEWHDVVMFTSWAIVNGYRDDLTIDRTDVDGNYEPSNCRWVTMKEQANNKRNNLFFEYNGKVQTLKQWSEELGIPYGTLSNRVGLGITVPNLFEKENFVRKDNTLLTYNGEILTMTGWSERLGIKLSTLSERYRRGLPPEKIFYQGSLNELKNKTIPR
ncbi:hypothetical protein M222_0742 [Enterococcus faecalis AZ19]|uniref:hypothetical protein n=1 Tax=Enterococcus faecalis TaxID=1351 RepID=UPI0004596CE4|nr:hypothetical protein [Enterococcus faecalis]KAJ76039.1 hypothetical protein M222_0742 [Enterococcus faecalis AZ19]